MAGYLNRVPSLNVCQGSLVTLDMRAWPHTSHISARQPSMERIATAKGRIAAATLSRSISLTAEASSRQLNYSTR